MILWYTKWFVACFRLLLESTRDGSKRLPRRHLCEWWMPTCNRPIKIPLDNGLGSCVRMEVEILALNYVKRKTSWFMWTLRRGCASVSVSWSTAVKSSVVECRSGTGDVQYFKLISIMCVMCWWCVLFILCPEVPELHMRNCAERDIVTFLSVRMSVSVCLTLFFCQIGYNCLGYLSRHQPLDAMP